MNNLETKLLQDFTLPYNQRLSLVGFLQSLPQGVQNQINTATSTLVGAGIGAAIAKLLLNMGIGGTIIFSILGGMAGRNFGVSNNYAPPAFNPLQNSGFRDTFGRLL
jgi:hypothetical protein